MNDPGTFILLSRSIIDSDVFASQQTLKIWIWCLCRANFKDRTLPIRVGKGERIVKLKRGQFLFGRHKAAEELGINGSTIYKTMKKLEAMGNISIESNNQYSVITVCNYGYYQDAGNYGLTANSQPTNNRLTTDAQPTYTDNNVNNDNNDKNEKEIHLPYPGDDFRQAWDKWKTYKEKEFRFKFKSEVSEQTSLNKLSKLANSKQEAIDIIDHAIANGWKGLYKINDNKPLKEKTNVRRRQKNQSLASGEAILNDNRGK